MHLKKSLAQNFLNNRALALDIVRSLEISIEDTVLEIGPGEGVLTGFIAAENPAYYFTIEIDDLLSENLKKRFPSVNVINADFLDYSLETDPNWLSARKRKIISNLPYNVTSPILEKIIYLPGNLMPEICVFMVQREFGERLILSKDKMKSSLSVFVSNKFSVEKLFDVGKEDFYPRPKVDSSVLRFIKKENPVMKFTDEKKAFTIIRKIFSQKRKKIKNSLEIALMIPREKAAETLAASGIDPSVRAEDMLFEQWEKLINLLMC